MPARLPAACGVASHPSPPPGRFTTEPAGEAAPADADATADADGAGALDAAGAVDAADATAEGAAGGPDDFSSHPTTARQQTRTTAIVRKLIAAPIVRAR